MIPHPLPAGACDCHVHVFGPAARYPFTARRTYTPGDASVAELDAMHARIGVDRVVLIQPSVYGVDNSCMAEALPALGPRARGVAVIDDTTGEADLDRLHRLGVRGVRVNIATHGMDDPEEAWRLLWENARRIRRLGWHVQVLTRLSVIAALSDRIPDLGLPLVVDHFGYADPALGAGQPGFAALVALVRAGQAHVKLSAIERLTGADQRAAIAPLISALVAANPRQLVWGSDWPHTGGGRGAARAITDIEPFAAMDDADALAALAAAVGDAATLSAILVENPARLYDF